MRKALTRSFFDRPTLVVARELLGKYIVHDHDGKTISLMITEVEAYDGANDLASHASRGRNSKAGHTPRATIMFGEAGRFYMFFTYGMHWMANVVTGAKNYPAAILLRGGVFKDETRDANKMQIKKILINDPARLTNFLKIDGTLNGKPARRATGVWFEDRGVKISRSDIIASKRIGVDYAGPIWAGKEWNFRIKS